MGALYVVYVFCLRAGLSVVLCCECHVSCVMCDVSCGVVWCGVVYDIVWLWFDVLVFVFLSAKMHKSCILMFSQTKR